MAARGIFLVLFFSSFVGAQTAVPTNSPTDPANNPTAPSAELAPDATNPENAEGNFPAASESSMEKGLVPDGAKGAGGGQVGKMNVGRRVLVKTEPPGAQIFFNGRYTGRSTPSLIGPIDSLSQVLMRKDCYEDLVWSAADEDDDAALTNEISITMIPLPEERCKKGASPAPTGSIETLRVGSEPEGGEIFVDGRKMRLETPSMLDNVLRNSVITIKKPGFQDCTIKVADSDRVSCTLRRLSGRPQKPKPPQSKVKNKK